MPVVVGSEYRIMIDTGGEWSALMQYVHHFLTPRVYYMLMFEAGKKAFIAG
jgi:hypothetical protein